jgi:hypothetical protein
MPVPNPETQHLLAGQLALADGTRLKATVHCDDRFWERAGKGCENFAEALERLQRLTSLIAVEAQWPDWKKGQHRGRWIALGPEVGLIVYKRSALTCYARGNRKQSSRPLLLRLRAA